MRLISTILGSLHRAWQKAGELTKHTAAAKDGAQRKVCPPWHQWVETGRQRWGTLPRKENQAENAKYEKDKLLQALHSC